MAFNIRRDLNARKNVLSKSIKVIEKKIEQLPDGRLNLKERNRIIYYYLVGEDHKEIYLGHDNVELIENLTQKDYLKRVLKNAKLELTVIERMLKIYPDTLAEDVFDQLPEGRKKYAQPINICDDDFAAKWMETPYVRKSFKKGSPEFYTLKGEKVRSKSEVIIADRLYANGIPYRYECPLKMGKKIIHPDYSILRMSDRKTVYLEHCGKIGDPQYTEDMLTRIKDYNEAGIILGDRLFLTFESDKAPLDVSLLDSLIKTHLR